MSRLVNHEIVIAAFRACSAIYLCAIDAAMKKHELTDFELATISKGIKETLDRIAHHKGYPFAIAHVSACAAVFALWIKNAAGPRTAYDVMQQIADDLI
jgi:hypothetical protein